MIPVMTIAANWIPNTSGILLEFIDNLLSNTNTSIQNGLAKDETEDVGFKSFVAWETNLPREMLLFIASLSERFGLLEMLLLGFFTDCHDLLNSTRF